QRRVVLDRLAFLEKMTSLTPPTRLENLFAKSGILAVQSYTGTWHLHPVAAGLPREAIELPKDADPRQTIYAQGKALAEKIRADVTDYQPVPLSRQNAMRASAALWWILYGRNESRFVPLSELDGEAHT